MTNELPTTYNPDKKEKKRAETHRVQPSVAGRLLCGRRRRRHLNYGYFVPPAPEQMAPTATNEGG
jgi:hypothetical protein